MKLVKPDRWRVKEHTPEVSMVIFIDQDNKTKIQAAKNQAIADVISFMDGALSRFLSPPRSMHFGSHIEIQQFSPNPEQPLEPTLRPEKNNQSLKFWRVTKGSPEIVEIVELPDRTPTLKALNISAKVAEIKKAPQGSSKPVSALDDSCKTDKFAAHVLKAHEEGQPRIICSGSTLSQILNWLMKLYSNCDRPLICFEKFNGSVWAHSLDDGESLTTQPEENLLFATSVENFLLQDVPKGEYVYASSIIKFGDLNLLTYFEVDGFEDGKPVEIKTQKSNNQFQQRNSVTSISNSDLFTVKNNYIYLHYKRHDLKDKKYEIKDGWISFESRAKATDNTAYLPMLSELLHQVLKILSTDADVDAVILQFIYTTEKINIMKVTKNGGKVDDSWKTDLRRKEPEVQAKASVEDAAGYRTNNKKRKQSTTSEPQNAKKSKSNTDRTKNPFEIFNN